MTMLTRRFAIAFAPLLVLSGSLAAAVAFAARYQVAAPAAGAKTIACRVLETHASDQPPVFAVVFHQRDRQDGPKLGALLVQNSGATVEIQVGDGGLRQTGKVFRLKSCFGRGLLVLPAGATAPKDGEAFTIKFPEDHASGN